MKAITQVIRLGCFSLGLSLIAVLDHGRPEIIAPVREDPPAVHGMLLVGTDAPYLSHLPMFQGEMASVMPHRYQAILEVSLSGASEEPQSEYATDRRTHPASRVYTVAPEPFVLPDLIASDQPRRSFVAREIVRGHFEKGGVPILREVVVDVDRVVYFNELDSGAPKSGHLEYLLFGRNGELFLAHLISAPADFDQVVAVRLLHGDHTPEELAQGVVVTLPGTVNEPTSRVAAGQVIVGVVSAKSPAEPREIPIAIERELYFEEGELRLPPIFGSTPEEAEAGFP